ncbi:MULTISPECIES: UbiA family prenyltransferase [unclassified Roseitalea]|uniref:UbiA family prenyltransferase n=1 Tax=unclassified Roseitalea TaxID=2639107 RepID=UPI00273E8441|nr:MULTISPECIES: UbiA family prenyltransferase [unclassified Roseitalea]
MDVRVDDKSIALAVDLDGTLISGDLLWECLFSLLRANPLYALWLPVWLARGKARFKHEIFSRVTIDPACLVYRPEVIAFLQAEKARGRTIVLATASDAQKAQQIAEHLDLFDRVIGSNAEINLKAHAKRDRLLADYGDAGFDYLGNSRDDVAIFEVARTAHAVAPDRAARDFVAEHDGIVLADPGKISLNDVARMLRVHQWAKNSLIAVPAILDHRIVDPSVILVVAGAFFAFSFLASAVYIFNDLFDLAMDRRHPTKRNRPLAAGRIDPATGVKVACGLIAVSVLIAAVLPIAFGVVLALYFVITTAYSLKVKRWLLLDVLTLASLYTIRIVAGMAAVAAAPSYWLLAFSVFFFLSLALVKRYVELDHAKISEKERLSGRGYRPEDKDVIAQAGMASGFAAIVVLALYLDSDAVYQLYAHPWLIWPICPLVLYLIMRVWILAKRREFNDDPVVFIATDWRSQIMIAFGASLMLFAGLFDGATLPV